MLLLSKVSPAAESAADAAAAGSQPDTTGAVGDAAGEIELYARV